MKLEELSREEDLLNYWEKTFTMWKNSPLLYSKFLMHLTEVFRTDFEDYAPIQMVGEYRETSNKILLLSMNPNANMKPDYIKFEHKQRKFSAIPIERKNIQWISQTDFATNYFTILKENNISKSFYTNIEKIIHYYEQENELNISKYELLQKRIVNINVVPFYSKKIKNLTINPVVQGLCNRIKKFYFESKFDTMVINGKMLYDELLNIEFIRNNDEESIPMTIQGKYSEIFHFKLEYNGLEKKGIVIPYITYLSDEQKKKIATEMRKTAEWNKENSCEVIQGISKP